jgi:hypothetical protein
MNPILDSSRGFGKLPNKRLRRAENTACQNDLGEPKAVLATSNILIGGRQKLQPFFFRRVVNLSPHLSLQLEAKSSLLFWNCNENVIMAKANN